MASCLLNPILSSTHCAHKKTLLDQNFFKLKHIIFNTHNASSTNGNRPDNPPPWGGCPKLTPRGMGNIEYELGINDENDEAYIRIAGNASSGAFNTKWVGVNEIRERLEKFAEETFRAIVLQELYKNQSTNNHGFFFGGGAILKAEGVLVGVEKPPSMLQMGEWTGLLEKIESLKTEGVSLTDHK